MNRVFTIYSSEKQIGKTMLGINLGVSLLNETQKSVVLVEFHADEESVPACSMLKLPVTRTLDCCELSEERVKACLQTHSSQLSLLTVNFSRICKEATTRQFMATLMAFLKDMFEYILVEISSALDAMMYEVIDETDICILMVSSLEYEQPIGIIGHHNFRVVINNFDMPKEAFRHLQTQHYILPTDDMTVDVFRKSAIPFVIQAPYRPISQVIGRLARDIGEKQCGIALTGGAALGLSQLGILDVLERNRMTIDMMTCVSFGALIGAAHASGIELRRMTREIVDWAKSCRIVSRLSWRRLFSRRFFVDSGLQTLCESLLGNVYFEDLQIPVNVVAIDTRTGVSEIFREGKVLDAITADMHIPGLFVPFAQMEHHLIDGSVISPTPVAPLKQMGANMTIAVAVTPTPAESQKYFRQDISGRLTPEQRAARQNYALVNATFDGLMEGLTETSLSVGIERVAPDVCISPQIQGMTWRDFHRVDELIARGAQATEAVISKIETLKWG